MADLPIDRMQDGPPFTYCAVDYFGPFYIKEKRKELKRYGCLFTCLTSRGVHIEVSDVGLSISEAILGSYVLIGVPISLEQKENYVML